MLTPHLERLTAAQQRLAGALVAGEDSGPHRDAIASIERDIQAAKSRQQQAEQEQLDRRSAAVAKRASVITDQTRKRCAAAVPALPRNPSFGTPEMTRCDSIQYAAERVAEAEQHLGVTKTAEAQATASVNEIAERIAAIERRKAKIRADLGSKCIDEAQAGGLYAIAAADLRDLGDLHREAIEKVGQAAKLSREAQNNLNYAQAELEREEANVKFMALAAYAERLDASLCAAVADLHALALQSRRPAANSLSALFRPSSQLSNMLMHRQIPRGGGA